MISKIMGYALWLTLWFAASSVLVGECYESWNQSELSPFDKTEIFKPVADAENTGRTAIGDMSRPGVATPLRFHSGARTGRVIASDVLEHLGGYLEIGGNSPMTIYYVATSGSNNASGSATQPFRSIQQALDAGLQPGDEVVVRAGTYQEAIYVNTGGSAAANVTVRAEVPGTVLIQPPSGTWNAISINSNYVTVSGFEVRNARGDGIEANNVHHIEVLNNVLYNNGESGIQFNGSDFILVDGNITYDNASDGWYSGISIYQNRNITGDTSTDEFRTIISNNISYDNVTATGDHTDGNGIIIDDFQSTQTGGFPNYTYPTLVENNLVYGNGGKGIQVVWSDGVTVRNNTAYHNNNDDLNVGTWRGEISNSQSSNNTFINNIAVADPGINSGNTAIDSTSYGGYQNENVTWISNLTFSGQTGNASVRTDGGNPTLSASDGNLLGVDPGFVNAPNNFRLENGSAAINAGSDAYGLPGADLDGLARAVGIVDMGAFESGSTAAPSGPSPTPPQPVPPAAPPEPTNTAPQANDDNGFETEFETPISFETASLLENDTDADGDALRVVSVSNAENGNVSLNGDTIVLTPDNGFSGVASFEKTVTDDNGGFSNSRVSVMVAEQVLEPVAAPQPPQPPQPEVPEPQDSFSIWPDATPDIPVDPDTNSVTLGLQFTADVDATLEGLRLYLTEANSGLDSIDLWSEDGTLLAHAHLHATGVNGWQTLEFDAPVQLAAGETYVASYFTDSGGYSVSEGFFNSAVDKGPISLGQNAGVYSYGSDAQFPDQSYQSSNYWVDLVLNTQTSGEQVPTEQADPTSPSVIGEAGVVYQDQADSETWHSVTFENALENPTVVMGGLTANGSQAYTVQVRDITSDGFEFQIDEWDYLDGYHVEEAISWVAIEAGTHELSDGRTITAASTSAGDRWKNVSFDDGIFDAAPVVFGQATDEANQGAVVDRIKDVTNDGFKTRLYAEEASDKDIVSGSFDWIAIEGGGSGDAGSVAGTTGRAVNHQATEVDFAGNFGSDTFAFITDLQTTYGSNTSTLRTDSLGSDMAMLSVLEEQSRDQEVKHTYEDAGFAGFEAAPILGVSLPVEDSFV